MACAWAAARRERLFAVSLLVASGAGYRLTESDESTLDSLRRNHEIRVGEFKHIIDASGAAQIKIIVLKGFSIARCYPPGALRYQGDFDFLVPKNAIVKFEILLESLGYICGAVSEDGRPALTPDWMREVFVDHWLGSGEYEKRVSANKLKLKIEPRFRLAIPSEPYIYDHDELFDSSVLETYEGVTFSSLSPAYHLIFQCVHIYTHDTEITSIRTRNDHALRRLVDVSYFMHKHWSVLTPPAVWAAADRVGAVVAVDYVLRQIDRIWPGTLGMSQVGLVLINPWPMIKATPSDTHMRRVTGRHWECGR